MFESPAELLVFCEADRTHLLDCLRARTGRCPDVPAEGLDAVIEDVLYFGLAVRPLPGRHLGWCDYDRRTIVINARLSRIALPNTDIGGLLHSTKAHELGHARLPHHETELRARPLRAGRGCPDDPQAQDAEARREFEADVYAGIFLVPTLALWATPEVAELVDAIHADRNVSSDQLWTLTLALAQRFQVTGSLMATRLKNLGLVEKQGRDLVLCLAPPEDTVSTPQ